MIDRARASRPTERRTADPYVSAVRDDKRRLFDSRFGVFGVRVLPGDFHVCNSAAQEEMIVTILGSCVAACIRDPDVGVGGMNHFMLPESDTGEWNGASASMRYGNYAMERLINEIIKAGGSRGNLEIKLFGGSNIVKAPSPVGAKNAEFARAYLAQEGLRAVAEDLGGSYPRRIHYFPRTGKVQRLYLRRNEDVSMLAEEKRYEQSLRGKKVEGDVELFD